MKTELEKMVLGIQDMIITLGATNNVKVTIKVENVKIVAHDEIFEIIKEFGEVLICGVAKFGNGVPE